jgi:hypothetical protein
LGKFRFCFRERSRAMRVIQSGSVATSSAARPDGTTCSAQCSEPWLMKKNRNPRIALPYQSLFVGR